MDFFCIAEEGSDLAFRFAGIETRRVSNRDEALEALRAALSMKNIGVILVTDEVFGLLREEADRITYAQGIPLILKIPSRATREYKSDLGDFLKRAIGASL